MKHETAIDHLGNLSKAAKTLLLNLEDAEQHTDVDGKEYPDVQRLKKEVKKTSQFLKALPKNKDSNLMVPAREFAVAKNKIEDLMDSLKMVNMRNANLLKGLQLARTMLHEWAEDRKESGLSPYYPELKAAIEEIEKLIARSEGENHAIK